MSSTLLPKIVGIGLTVALAASGATDTTSNTGTDATGASNPSTGQ